jgi:4-diphosphocytidyl-2-C-methyl-D-erythritol kinase
MREAARELVVEAPAKINLYLRVLAPRPDGYHEIETLFQAVELADRLEVARTSGGIELEVEDADLGPAAENLVHRAAQTYLEHTGLPFGVQVRLQKRIPAGAGLGGGSSDAAAVLRALEILADGEGLGASRLSELGSELGSDVPFFLGGSTLAVGRGRGERLEPRVALPAASVVVVLPPVHVVTGAAYRALARQRRTGRWPHAEQAPLEAQPGTWEGVVDLARNDFESVVPGMHPEIARSLQALRETGAAPALLSGSGAACFGVLPDETTAEGVAEDLSALLGWPAVVTRTLARFPDPGSAASPRA